METKRLLDELGGFNLVERGVVSMKGKGDRVTYWIIGEDPFLRDQRSSERAARRGGGVVLGDSLVPRSSLKNKSLARTTFLRCSSESPKRLRFASSDQLDQQSQRNGSRLESIADNSPCKRRPSCAPGSNCMDTMRSASSSCPCVEKLCDVVSSTPTLTETGSSANYTVANSLPVLKNAATRNSRLKASLGFQMVCRSAPSSPRHSSLAIDNIKRSAQSTEEIDGWDSTPLIYSNSQCPDWFLVVFVFFTMWSTRPCFWRYENRFIQFSTKFGDFLTIFRENWKTWAIFHIFFIVSS